jgi:SAM-dependent methyltransferase
VTEYAMSDADSVTFVCAECRSPLSSSERGLRCANDHYFSCSEGVYNMLPPSVNPLALEDAQYHATQKDTWIDLNQVTAYRNLHYHESLLGAVKAKAGLSSRILEIGGGVGFDLNLFLQAKPQFQLYVFSEISRDLAAYVASQYPAKGVIFCAADAQRLPFPDSYFDCVYMVATLHHLEDIEGAMKELVRVTKSEGEVCCGIEPNAFWQHLISSTKVVWRRLLPERAHSPADEQAHGVTWKGLARLAQRHGLTVARLEPVWLLCGFAHYGLEFLYRLFRLRRRIKLPLAAERFLVACDTLLLKLPGFKYLSWHYTVVYQKG